MKGSGQIPPKNQYDVLLQRIKNLEAKVAKTKNDTTPTVPIYDPGNFPAVSIEGQLALGTDENAYKFQNGTWSQIGGGGASEPLIMDYFNAVEFGNPDPTSSTGESTNWLKWREEANWSGYPDPIIGVDDVTTGVDGFGVTIDQRYIYVVNSTTAPLLVKVEMALGTPGIDSDRWWTLRPVQYYGAPGVSWTILSSVGSYGIFNDFPIQERPPAHSLSESDFVYWYHQLIPTYAYYAVAAQVTQSYPSNSSDDFTDNIEGQCIVTIVKNDAFAGGIFT